MFIQITAFLSIFQLIFAVDSTNLLLTGSENLSRKNISDDIAVKNIPEQFELLHTINENVRAKMTSLGVYFNEHLMKQKKEIEEDLEELKAALIVAKKLSDSEKAKGPNTIYRSRDFRNENSETKESACQTLPTNCAEALEENGIDGVYKVEVPGSKYNPMFLYCVRDKRSNDTDPWTIIQRRQDGSIDFSLNWDEYRNGFGNLEREFFIGLDKLHEITDSSLHELWIEMEDFEGEIRWAKYDSFAIGNENESYALNVLGNYSGDAGDSLTFHEAQKWATKDKDNDASIKRNCAATFNGAWWYSDCLSSNLNGVYLKKKKPKTDLGHGVIWESFRGLDYSLKYVHMAVRPISNIPYCTEISQE